jgi:uncharacterized protein RhaS with RHS repeats
VLDEGYYYQHDAFGRLVQVSERGGVELNSTGVPVGEPGAWLKHFTYDGLGRLIRVQSPWPFEGENPPYVATTRYYYDGSRRVQEVSSTPIALDGEGKPIEIDKEVELEDYEIVETPEVSREYVWDPGEADRLLAMYGPLGVNVYYVVTDAGATPTAMLDDGGRVVALYSFDAHGLMLDLDEQQEPPALHAGFQGLFFEDFEPPIVAGARRIAPGRDGLYYNRARWYSAELGRFLTPDPNATGLAINAGLPWHGEAPQLWPQRPDVSRLYRDGSSLYQSRWGNPASYSDETGLFFGIVAQLAVMANSAYEDAESTLEEARQGVITSFGLARMLEEYRILQLMDAEWASDWSQSDYDYSSGDWIVGNEDDPAEASEVTVNDPSRSLDMAALNKNHSRNLRAAADSSRAYRSTRGSLQFKHRKEAYKRAKQHGSGREPVYHNDRTGPHYHVQRVNGEPGTTHYRWEQRRRR